MPVLALAVCALLCNVTLNTDADVATGLAKVIVNVPDPLVILASASVPTPSSNVPLLL